MHHRHILRVGSVNRASGYVLENIYNYKLQICALVPCFGFVFGERDFERDTRSIVILGDTSDPSAIRPLAQNPDVLVHESTLAYIPPIGEKNLQKYAPNVIHEKAVKRGHSTAEMAGQFAKSINARILALNHFSAR